MVRIKIANYGEDQNRETSFRTKGLQAAVDGWCKIQVLDCLNLSSSTNARKVMEKLFPFGFIWCDREA